ncbi:hypothetical protein Tco_0998319, partial [Tanacetum coccineum]
NPVGAAANAPKVAKGAPDVDEGAQAVPAIVHAPQPPPVAVPTRSMAQRLSRLEEEVHNLRDDIGEQRDVSGVRYTSYVDTRIPYQRRRVRQRTGEASTSAAPLDEDQPDP